MRCEIECGWVMVGGFSVVGSWRRRQSKENLNADPPSAQKI